MPAVKRVAVVRALIEGNSVHSTCHITIAAKGTVLKSLAELGANCGEYQRQKFVNLPCTKIQCDEVWSFVWCKEQEVPREERGRGRGDTWKWTAIYTYTKIIPAWHVGVATPMNPRFFGRTWHRL